VAAHVVRQITNGFAQQPRFLGALVQFRQCKWSVSRADLSSRCGHFGWQVTLALPEYGDDGGSSYGNASYLRLEAHRGT
jgi:hypothetical protein